MEIKDKYGFPLFTKNSSSVYLGNEKKLIISDIWAFWDYVIKKKNHNKKFQLSLLDQAQNFYASAEAAPMRSKPLLFYYSFLNLSKIILSIDYGYDDSREYIHGIGEKNNATFRASEITLHPTGTTTGRIKVASELLRLFQGTTITHNTTINLKDFLKHCVGIHRAYSEVYKQPEIFYKLCDIEYFKEGKKIAMKAKIQCNNGDLRELTARGYNIINESGANFLFEQRAMTRYMPAREDYFNLSQQILSKGLWYFIGNEGYTMYLSSEANHRYPPEIIIYNTIFYLGSITRYHPYLFDDIFDATEQWLMSEFLTTQPKQFLYLATAKLIGQKVQKAYSSF